MSTYQTLANSVGKQAVQIVELQLDACSLTYGASPCQAILNVTGSDRCYNTFGTCQSTPTYRRITKFYRFATTRVDGMQQPGDPPVFPTLLSVKTSPTILTPGKGLGVRSAVQCKIQDHPWTDSGMDPYVTQRAYDPDHRGSFWGKFTNRNKYYQNRVLLVHTGFLNPDGAYDSANFVQRRYIITKISGPNPDGTVDIEAKDPLKLADDDRYKWPKISAAVLAAPCVSTDVGMEVTDSNGELGPWWAAGQRYLRIKDEIMLATEVVGTISISVLQSVPLAYSFPGQVGYTEQGYALPSYGGAASYAVTAGSIPVGCTLDTTEGIIYGTPTTVATYTATITATNSLGSQNCVVVINVVLQPAQPLITSDYADVVYHLSAVAFSYSIVATASPTAYDAANLPPGLTINTSTGVISGSITNPGVYPITIKAYNGFGFDSRVLIVIAYASLPIPEILSAYSSNAETHSESALIGAFYGYQIQASNNPTAYAATGLPPGLTVNTTTGLISGQATTVGEYTPTFTASNATGASSSQSFEIQVTAVLSTPVVLDGTGPTAIALPVRGNILPLQPITGTPIFDPAFNLASNHAVGESVQWCWLYLDEMVYNIVYDLLTRVANIDPAYLPVSDWAAKINAGFSYLHFTALLVKPVGLKQLLQELTELSVLIWWHERDQVIKMSGLSFQQVVGSDFSDTDSIVAESFQSQDDTSNLSTEWWLYYDLTWPLGNMKLLDTFRTQDVLIASDKEGPNEYARPTIRALTTRWLFSTNPEAVRNIASVMITQYQDVRKLATWTADPKDDGKWVGDTASVVTKYMQDASGLPLPKNFLLTQVEEVFDNGSYKLKYTGMELYAFNRVGVLSNPPYGASTPVGPGPYASASTSDKNTYMFLGYPIPEGETHGFFPDGTFNYVLT